MRLSKRFLPLVSTVILMLIGGLVIAPPSVVQGAPQQQATSTAPPRPPIDSLLTPTPTSSAGVAPTRGSPVVSEIDLALVVDKEEAQPGDLLHYKAQVINVAGKSVTNVWLTCDLPDGVQVEEVSSTRGEIHNYGQRISFELGPLQPAFESQFVTIKARIRDDVEPGAELIHYANLTSDQAGGGERSVKTIILGAKPELTATVQSSKTTLPVTGNGTIPLWLIVGFALLIVAVALIGFRERVRLSR